MSFTSSSSLIVLFFIILSVNGIILLILQLVKIYIYGNQFDQEFEKNKVKHELVTSQIYTNFVLNNFDRIDAVILEDPHDASTYLNQVTEVLRLTLDAAQSEKIPLSKEINNIEKYLELKVMRGWDKNLIVFEADGIPLDLSITPMLFLAITDITFKQYENINNRDQIKLRIKYKYGKLLFSCACAFKKTYQRTNDSVNEELFTKLLECKYPGKYIFNVSSSRALDKVELIISLQKDLQKL